MTARIADICAQLAEDAVIDMGQTLDRLKKLPMASFIDAQLFDDAGRPITGHEALKEMSMHLLMFYEAIHCFVVEQARMDSRAGNGRNGNP